MKIKGALDVLALIGGAALFLVRSTLVNSDEPPRPTGSSPPRANATSQPVGSPPMIESRIRRKNPTGEIPKPTVALKPGESPKPVFDHLEYQFGEIKAGTDILHDFKFKNAGNGSLEILAVRPGCGCTTSGDYEKIIPPGGEGKIPLKIATGKLKGDVSKTVSVHTNGTGTDNLIILTIKGTVKPLYQVEPAKLEFGSLKMSDIAGKPMTKSVVITNQGDKPLELKNLRSTNPNFKTAMKTLEPGQKYEITVEIGSVVRTGSNGGNVQVDTNYEDMPLIHIPAAFYANAPLDVMPSQMHLTSPRKMPFTRAFFIRNNTQKPETLSELRVSDPKLRVRLEEATPGMAWKISLDVPTDYEGKATGDTITVKTSNAEVPELIVDIFTQKIEPTTRPATTEIGNPNHDHAHEHAGH